MFSALALFAAFASAAHAFPGGVSSKGSPSPPKLTLGIYQAPGPSDLRGPCPALNSLANHGVLPRDGKNIPGDLLVQGLGDVLSLGPKISNSLVDLIFSSGLGDSSTRTFNLSALCTHNAIEHDASLVHDDANLGNQCAINPKLLSRLLSASSDGKFLTASDIGRYRKVRHDESKASNPQFNFGLKQQIAAFAEAGVVLALFGGEDHKVPIEFARTFFGEERIPETWQRRSGNLNTFELAQTTFQVKYAAGLFDS